VARVEVPTKVTGQAKYAMDVQVPGMVYAAVLQSPYFGGAPQTVDDSAARKVAGISDVVKLPDGVAVIGNSVEGTQAAKGMLKVTWGPAPGQNHDSEKALAEFAEVGRDKSRAGVPYETAGDAKAAMAGAARVYRGEYRTRYVYHAQMEPLSATASVSPDGKSAEIWAGTQGATGLLNQAAALLQTDRSKLTLHQHVLGGGFGRRGQQEVVMDALQDRQVQVGVDPVTGDPIFANVPVSPSMAAGSAAASSRFFDEFAPGGTHAGYLTPAELRLLSEWVDIGAQYYNNPFAAPPN